MKAVVVDSAQRAVQVVDRALPSPAAGEALVRVRRAGICGTDLEIVRGYMHFDGVLGHEFVGRVEACDDSAWIGRRVVGGINASCRTCPTCLRGQPRHCPGRTVLGILGRDGAMATHVALPVDELREVPDTLGDEHAVFAEPLAAALEILEQVHVRPSDDVLILGDGRLAQLCAQVLLLHGCHVTVSGRHEAKLALVAQRGARTVHADAHAAALPGTRHDLVVDATGSAEGAALALSRCRPRGTVVLKSTVASAGALPIVPTIVDEITVVGSRCGELGPALRLLDAGHVEVAQLVSGVYPLAKAREAFAFAETRGVLKVLLDCADE